MSKSVRISDSAYENLKQIADSQNISITAAIASQLNESQSREIDSSAALKTGAPLQVTLVDKRQDARIDEHGQHIKELKAATLSNRVGILQIAEDMGKAKEVGSIIDGAYDKLMEMDMSDFAKEIRVLSNAVDDGSLDEDDEDDLDYYDDPEDDDDDE